MRLIEWGPRPFLVSIAVFLGAACAGPVPDTPAQKAANRAVGFQIAASDCPRQSGGFNDRREMQSLAAKNRNDAIDLGATKANFDLAERAVRERLAASMVIGGREYGCNELLNSLAIAST